MDNYIVFYNATMSLFPFFDDDRSVATKRALDQAAVLFRAQHNTTSSACPVLLGT